MRPRLTLAVLLVLAACRPAAREEVRYADPLASGRLRSSRGAVGAKHHFCGDENRYSLELAPGEELTGEVELGRRAVLSLAGCVGRPEVRGHRDTTQDALHLELVAVGAGAPWRRTVAVPPHPLPFREEVALDLPPGPVRWTLRNEQKSLRRIFLRDFAFRGEFERRFKEISAGKSPDGSSATARQILLISVDTLRGDALGALGGPWATPHLDRFAARAQIWSPHYAAASWTKPSHASLLTGYSPLVHQADGFETKVPEALPLLSERFHRGGFRTAGLVSDCVWLDPSFGFGRGYDEYRAVPWNLPQMVRETVNWMAEHRDEPFFYFFHTFEVHSDFHYLPYEAPGVRRPGVEERFGVGGYGCRQGNCASGLLAEINEGRLVPLPNEAEILRYLYGESVRHVDEQLGRLFADLKALGLLDSLLVVLTADHGEAFLEHGETLHGTYWNEVLQVPLVIHWPRGRHAGERARFATSSLDVAPTLLAAAGLPQGGLPGQNLGAASGPRPVFSWSPGRTVVAGSWKAVLKSGRGDLLFDLASDPGERRDRAGSERERLAALARLLGEEQQRGKLAKASLGVEAGGGKARPLSEEERRRIEALGYLGGGAPPH